MKNIPVQTRKAGNSSAGVHGGGNGGNNAPIKKCHDHQAAVTGHTKSFSIAFPNEVKKVYYYFRQEGPQCIEIDFLQTFFMMFLYL